MMCVGCWWVGIKISLGAARGKRKDLKRKKGEGMETKIVSVAQSSSPLTAKSVCERHS